MSELISGKEALIALANGEEVEFKDGTNKWENIQHHLNLDLSMFLTAPDWMTFRLKPRTITINGIEVAAPFEPKHGDIFWYLDLTQICSYNYRQEWSDSDEYTQLGVWRTEEEIKQVVAALRSIFNEKTKEGDPS